MALQDLLNDPIVIDMVIKGIYPTIKAGGLEIEGFYKAGTILLYEENGKLYAGSRYDRVDEITCLRDLVQLNFDWWEYSKGYSPFLIPDSRWLNLLLEYEFVEEKVIKTNHYIVKGR